MRQFCGVARACYLSRGRRDLRFGRNVSSRRQVLLSICYVFRSRLLGSGIRTSLSLASWLEAVTVHQSERRSQGGERLRDRFKTAVSLGASLRMLHNSLDIRDLYQR